MAESGATPQEITCLEASSAEGAIHYTLCHAVSALCPGLHSNPGALRQAVIEIAPLPPKQIP